MPRLLAIAAILGISVTAHATEPHPYRVASPDILQIEVSGIPDGQQPVNGDHLVRPDGTIDLGEYGRLEVTGRVAQEIQRDVKEHLSSRVKNATDLDVFVGISAHNSQACYVIVNADGAEAVHRFVCIGNERVADAILDSEGRSRSALAGRVWLSRGNETLEVDWHAITQDGETATNYRLEAGDRIHIDNQTS